MPPRIVWRRGSDRWRKEQKRLKAQGERRAAIEAKFGSEKAPRFKKDLLGLDEAQIIKLQQEQRDRWRQARSERRRKKLGCGPHQLGRTARSRWYAEHRKEIREATIKRRVLRYGRVYVEHETPMPTDGRCPHCRVEMTGTFPAPDAPTVDHIVPLARGGHHEPGNTEMICHQCNTIKGSRAASWLRERLLNTFSGSKPLLLFGALHEKVISK